MVAENVAVELQPFTLEHFRLWAESLVLDNGEFWVLEEFQARFVDDLFQGRPENWLVVPEGNGKTTLVAGLSLYFLQHQAQAAIPVAASSREQAEIMYRQAEGFILRTEWMTEPARNVVVDLFAVPPVPWVIGERGGADRTMGGCCPEFAFLCNGQVGEPSGLAALVILIAPTIVSSSALAVWAVDRSNVATVGCLSAQYGCATVGAYTSRVATTVGTDADEVAFAVPLACSSSACANG